MLHAASRLTPGIAAHQIQRAVRNRMVPLIPGHYKRQIRAAAATLPLASSCDRIPSDLTDLIGAFYAHPECALKEAGQGRFTVLGRAVDFGSIDQIDWSHRMPDEHDCYLWRIKLMQLEIIHSLVTSGQEGFQQTAIDLLESFDASRSFAQRDAFVRGWSPYGASHRILAIVSALAVVTRTGRVNAVVKSKLEEFARTEAAFLWANIEYELRNNHTERNLAALCLYHLGAQAISGKQARKLERSIKELIDSTVLGDGMQVERSAMYQGLTVMALQIFAASWFLTPATRELAQQRAEKSAGAWLFLTHRDGEIALFNDSWVGEVPPPAEVLDPAAIAVPAALDDAGYFRLSSGRVELIFDAGAIGPPWNPGHGHADFLSMEVDHGGHRFLVDPGTSQYSTGPQRDYERSSGAHNGPRYVNVEPVEYRGGFKVGRLVAAEPLSQLRGMSVAAVGGRVQTPAGWCARVCAALPAGGILIVDRWSSSQTPGVTSLLVPSDWQIVLAGNTLRAEKLQEHASITVYQGQVGAVGSTTWSRCYLETESAHAVTLLPIRTSVQQLVFGIAVIRPRDVAEVLAEVGETLGISLSGVSPETDAESSQSLGS